MAEHNFLICLRATNTCLLALEPRRSSTPGGVVDVVQVGLVPGVGQRPGGWDRAGAGIHAPASRMAATGCPARSCCGVAPGLVSLKGFGGHSCGAEHAAPTTGRAAPPARKWAPWQPAAAATAGPAGPRLRLAQLVQGAAAVCRRRPPWPMGRCMRRKRILLVLNPSIILGSKRAHFPGEHNTEYYTEYYTLSSYRV